MDRNFLKGAHGDAANAILAAAGYSFRRLLAWFAIFWLALITAMLANPADAAIAPFGAAQASLMRPAAANRAYFTVDYIALETAEETQQTDCCRRKPRECPAILRPRKSRQLARTSWWSGGDSSRDALGDAFANLRWFSVECERFG